MVGELDGIVRLLIFVDIDGDRNNPFLFAYRLVVYDYFVDFGPPIKDLFLEVRYYFIRFSEQSSAHVK